MNQYEILGKISESFREVAPAPISFGEDNPFNWLLTRPSATIGAYGAKFASELFRANDVDVLRPLSGSDHDRVMNGHRMEIKFCTRRKEDGVFWFEQIRDQEYDYVLCLAISADDANCWVIPKSELIQPREGLTPQHCGEDGIDTLQLQFAPDAIPSWLQSFGGTLEEGLKVFKDTGTGPYSGRPLRKQDLIHLDLDQAA
jgi:hypothetical protein